MLLLSSIYLTEKILNVGLGKKFTLISLSNVKLTSKSFLSLFSIKVAIFCLSTKNGKMAARIKQIVKKKKENFKNLGTVN